MTNDTAIVPKVSAMDLAFGDKGVAPQNWAEAMAVCGKLAELAGDMIPEHWNSQGKVLAGLQRGAEMGFSMMESLQYLYPVKGRLACMVEGGAALLNRHRAIDGRIETEYTGEGDDLSVTVTVKRRGWSSSVSQTISLADCKDSGVYRAAYRSGKPTPWKTHPQRMIRATALRWLIRDHFADVMGGTPVMDDYEIKESRALPPSGATARVVVEQDPILDAPHEADAGRKSASVPVDHHHEGGGEPGTAATLFDAPSYDAEKPFGCPECGIPVEGEGELCENCQ